MVVGRSCRRKVLGISSADGSRGKVLEPWDGSRKVLSSEGLVVGRSWV
jgi:hypothetical protein